MGVRQIFSTSIEQALVGKLHNELVGAGLEIEGVAELENADVAVDFINTPSAGDITTAQAIIDTHDATDYVAQVQEGAKAQLSAISNWATWDEAAALAWFDANVSTTADALPVLRAIVRMLIALRNQAYPDLQG